MLIRALRLSFTGVMICAELHRKRRNSMKCTRGIRNIFPSSISLTAKEKLAQLQSGTNDHRRYLLIINVATCRKRSYELNRQRKYLNVLHSSVLLSKTGENG